MATEKLIIEVSETGALVVKRDLDAVGKSAQTTEGMVKLLQRALGAFAVGMLVRELMALSGAFIDIQNTVRKFTRSETELTALTKDLYTVAQQTRQSLEGTTEVYTQVREAIEEWGGSAAEALQITRSLNQAVLLSGGSADTARTAIYQLTKGITQGSISGMELRSILRDTDVVAEVLAKQLGITKGQLRKMGEEGKISAEVILAAFKNAKDFLEQKFLTMMPTIRQSFTMLKNAGIELVGTWDQNTGASQTFAKAIVFVSDHLRDLISTAKVLTTTLIILFSPQILSAALTLGTNLALGMTKAITSVTMLNSVLLKQKANELTIVSTNMDTTAVPKAVAQVGKLGAAFKSLWKIIAANPWVAVGAVLIGGVTFAFDQMNKKMAEAEAIQEAAHARALSMIQAKRREVQTVTAGNKAVADYIVTLKQENMLLRLDEQQRELKVALLKAEAAAKRPLNELEIQSIVTQTREKQAITAANTALQERASFLKEIKGPQEEYAAKIAMVNSFLKDHLITEEQSILKKKELEEAYKKLAAEDLLPKYLADLRQENELLKFNTQEQEVQRALIAARTAAGKDLTPEQQKEIQTLIAQKQALENSNTALARQAEVLNEIKGPQENFRQTIGILTMLLLQDKITIEEYNEALKKLKETTKENVTEHSALAEALGSAMFEDATAALTEFVSTGKLEFKDFARSVIGDIMRITARLLLMKAFTAMGIPGLPTAQHGASFNVGGTGGTDSQVVAFRATPGEHVQVTPPTGGSAPMTAAPAQSTRIVNMLDPHLMLDAMSTSQGERVILNVIRRNPTAIRRVLGG